MDNWKDVYTAIADRITAKLDSIKWIDLWHEQVPNTNDEYGFPSPAVFVAFHSKGVTDLGNFVQDIDLQVDLYLYDETTASSEHGGSTESTALGYLELLGNLNALFHGYKSTAFSRMRKIGIQCVDNVRARYLYCLSFECVVEDSTAMPTYSLKEFGDVTVSLSSSDISDASSLTDDEPLFDVE